MLCQSLSLKPSKQGCRAEVDAELWWICREDRRTDDGWTVILCFPLDMARIIVQMVVTDVFPVNHKL